MLLSRDPGPGAGKTPPPGAAGNTGLALCRKSPFIGPWSQAKLEPNQPFLQLPKEVSRDLGLVGRGDDKGVPWCRGLEALLVLFTTGYMLSAGWEGFFRVFLLGAHPDKMCCRKL